MIVHESQFTATNMAAKSKRYDWRHLNTKKYANATAS